MPRHPLELAFLLDGSKRLKPCAGEILLRGPVLSWPSLISLASLKLAVEAAVGKMAPSVL